jgi:hypothetical protein
MGKSKAFGLLCLPFCLVGSFIGVVFCIKLMSINGLRNYQEQTDWGFGFAEVA